ncbi:MAG: protein-export chaperone SecB [Sphingomonadales bacterium]
MAEKENGQDAAAAQQGAVGEGQQVQVGVLAQYVKDFSFENPNAPAIFQKQSDQKPQIDVNVNVNARKAGEETYEVDLKMTASAKQGDETAFMVELVYAGLFAARNLPQESLQPFLLIECPRILFPFARRIISDATRDGGFPPLMLEPIDFAALYRQHLQQQQEQTAGDGPSGSVETSQPIN